MSPDWEFANSLAKSRTRSTTGRSPDCRMKLPRGELTSRASPTAADLYFGPTVHPARYGSATKQAQNARKPVRAFAFRSSALRNFMSSTPADGFGYRAPGLRVLLSQFSRVESFASFPFLPDSHVTSSER